MANQTEATHCKLTAKDFETLKEHCRALGIKSDGIYRAIAANDIDGVLMAILQELNPGSLTSLLEKATNLLNEQEQAGKSS